MTINNFRQISRLVLVPLVALSLAMGVTVTGAQAASVTSSSSETRRLVQAQSDYIELYNSLAKAGGTQTSTGLVFNTEYGSLTLPKPPSVRVGAGMDGWRPYVHFSPLEQRMIIGGSTAGLAAAICLVATPAGCVAAAAIIGAATVFLTERGVCPGSTPRARIYVGNTRPPRCTRG